MGWGKYLEENDLFGNVEFEFLRTTQRDIPEEICLEGNLIYGLELRREVQAGNKLGIIIILGYGSKIFMYTKITEVIVQMWIPWSNTQGFQLNGSGGGPGINAEISYQVTMLQMVQSKEQEENHKEVTLRNSKMESFKEQKW